MRGLKHIIAGALLLASSAALAQSTDAFSTYPAPVTSTSTSNIVAVTNTFQSVFSAPTNIPGQRAAVRRGCIIGNHGSNKMFVYFGPLSAAASGASIPLAANTSITCSFGGVVSQDAIAITGTAGDQWSAFQQ